MLVRQLLFFCAARCREKFLVGMNRESSFGKQPSHSRRLVEHCPVLNRVFHFVVWEPVAGFTVSTCSLLINIFLKLSSVKMYAGEINFCELKFPHASEQLLIC